MSSRFQQQSLNRKLVYFALIVALLSLAWVVRYSRIDLGALQLYGVLPQAQALGLRERDLGGADLTGSTLNLTLTGSRGLVVCILWWEADKLRQRHEWNELELRIRLITKLQPYYLEPWLFQSHNLAYNVPDEFERIQDKYFYVSRGIELLAEGARRNRDNPDLRYTIGYYYSWKFGLSDENRTMRCLLQLSCIDPVKRHPAQFHIENDPLAVNWEEFETFCKDHPFLVRRLREQLGYDTPAKVIDFLKDNQRIPSRFEDHFDPDLKIATLLKPPGDQFPILPPKPVHYPVDEISQESGELPDSVNNFAIARAWFGYAQDPLSMQPPRNPRVQGKPIFQSYPARAQAYRADRMEKEGWFDEGWEIQGWFPRDKSRPNGSKRSITVASHRKWAQEEWEKAYRLYKDLGRRAGLERTPEEEAQLSPQERRHDKINWDAVNYGHFIALTDMERRPEAVQARKYFYKAERLRRSAGLATEILDLYENPAAFGPPSTWDKTRATGWKKIFLDPRHRAYRNDTDFQEDIYRIQLKYLDIVRKVRGPRLNLAAGISDLLLQAPATAMTGALWRPPVEFGRTVSWPFQGPFDDVDDEGKPLINKLVVNMFAPPPKTEFSMTEFMTPQSESTQRKSQ